MKFTNIITGKVFGMKSWEKKAGGKYQTFTFSYGVKNEQGTWNNTYLNITHFGDEVKDGQLVSVSGKFEPNMYTKKDGTKVETLKFISFEIANQEENTDKVLNLDDITDDDLDITPTPF